MNVKLRFSFCSSIKLNVEILESETMKSKNYAHLIIGMYLSIYLIFILLRLLSIGLILKDLEYGISVFIQIFGFSLGFGLSSSFTVL